MKASISRISHHVVGNFCFNGMGQKGVGFTSKALGQFIAIISGPETTGGMRRGCQNLYIEGISKGNKWKGLLVLIWTDLRDFCWRGLHLR